MFSCKKRDDILQLLYMLIKQKIKNLIKESGTAEDQKAEILEPEQDQYGDYSTNLALQAENPQEKAQEIKEKVESSDEAEEFLEKVEVASGGFVNFTLRKEFLWKQLASLLEKGTEFGSLNVGSGEKINVEFVSINPTGKLHMGHARGAFFGDALTRILNKAGYDAKSEYLINNAKTSQQIIQLGKTALGKGEQYDTPYLRELIAEHKNVLKDYDDPSEAGYYMAGVIMEEIKNLLEDTMRIHFNRYFEEENLHEEGKIDQVLQELRKKDLVYIEDQALWLKTSQFGDEKDRVIVRKDGTPGYFLPDIAYHIDKTERGFKKLIDIWGADHQGHKKRMEAAGEIFDFKNNLEVLITQLVSLKTKEGGTEQMSKRKGTAINLDDFVKEAGVDAARFIILSKDLSTHMSFNMEMAKKQTKENPVYYVQYAAVRALSLFRRADVDFDNFSVPASELGYLKTTEELRLIRKLIKFPDLIKETAQSRQVHHLPTYLHELATLYNDFYEKQQVLIDNDKNLTQARLALSKAVRTVIREGLGLLGIKTPERM